MLWRPSWPTKEKNGPQDAQSVHLSTPSRAKRRPRFASQPQTPARPGSDARLSRVSWKRPIAKFPTTFQYSHRRPNSAHAHTGVRGYSCPTMSISFSFLRTIRMAPHPRRSLWPATTSWLTGDLHTHSSTVGFSPDAPEPSLRFGQAKMALSHILEFGGSAYLPKRMTVAELEAGRFHLVKDAPEIQRQAHAVYLVRSARERLIKSTLELFEFDPSKISVRTQ